MRILPHTSTLLAIAIVFCLTPAAALATNAPTPAQTVPQQGLPTTTGVPAPNSPQAIQELHTLLQNAYEQGAMSHQGQAPHRPVLAAWVEVLRNAILSIGSAAFIAAWGFAIGMILMGIAALIFAIRRPKG